MNYPDNRAKLEFPAKVGKSCKVNLRMHEITPKTDAERRGLSQFSMSRWPLLRAV